MADRLILKFRAKLFLNILGEEVITILPFLAILYWLTKSLGVGRKGAIIGAWLLTALRFRL